jgi:hypothetical protein
VNQYFEHELKDESIREYIVEHLDNGRTLSHIVDIQGFTNPKIYTYCDNRNCNSTNYLQSSDIVDYELSVRILVSLIKDYLNSGKDKLVVFENSTSQKVDPWLKNAKSKYFSYNEEVYHYLTYEDINEECIRSTISESSGWLNSIFFTSHKCHFEEYLQDDEQVIKLLNYISKNIKMIAIDAYDWDGYIYIALV